MPIEQPRQSIYGNSLNFGDILGNDEPPEEEVVEESNGPEEPEEGRFWNVDNFVFDPDEVVCFGVVFNTQTEFGLNITLKGGIEKLVFSFKERKDALKWRDILERKLDERYGKTKHIRAKKEPVQGRIEALEIE